MGLIADIHKDLENGALQLIVEYHERLHVLAAEMCGDEAQAEDLVFRTFERVLTKAKTYKSDTNLFGWMKSIMENIRKDDLKRPVVRNTTAVEPEELEQMAGADWSTDEQIVRNSDCEALRAALRDLPPEYKQTVILRFYEDLSLKEIARILNKPVGTIGRRIHVALHLLAGKLSAEFGKAKKPLAVLLAALLGVGSLFGAWKAGLLDPLLSWRGEAESFPLQEESLQSGAIAQAIGEALPESFPLQEEAVSTQTQPQPETNLVQEETVSTQAEPPPATDLKENQVTQEQVNTKKAEREDAMNGKKLMMAAVAASAAVGAMADYTPIYRGLPKDYTQVEYIQSSGTQYINLKINAQSGLSLETDMSWVELPSDAAYCAAKTPTQRIYLLWYSGGWMFGYGQLVKTFVTATANEIYHVESALRNGSQTATAVNSTGSTELDWANSPAATGDIDLETSLYLFAYNQGNAAGNKCKARCYALKIWQDDGAGGRDLVGDFVPCLNKSGAAGLYDLVTEEFFAPSAALAYGEPVRQSIDPSPYDGNVYVGADREGEWSVASNWSYGHVPTEGEDVFIVDRIVAASGPISVNSLTIKEGGVLTVQAAPAKTPADLPSIFDDATQVTVAGELKVESGARLRPICDALTGAPVVFRVGSFTLDFGGRVWCDDAGFVWVKCDEAPEGAYTDTNGQDTYCTYAPGRGTDTEHGGAYGCAGANPAYGFAYAPFLPGAPGTCRAGSANVASYNFGGRGGGAFVLLSSGTVSLSGDVTCRSVDCTKCSGAGGGIWIVGSDFKVAPCARLVADSGMSTSRATDYAGTGGRISLAANLLDADIAALVKGETPDGLNYTNTLDFISASVQAGRGGLNATTGERVTASRPGTITFVTRGDGSYVTEIPTPEPPPAPVYPDPAGDGRARTFVGEDGGDWDDAANWSPSGVPGNADAVTIDGKWVCASGIVHAASLTVNAGATLTVGGTLQNITAQKPFADSTGFGLKIAGDLTVAGDLSIGGADSPVPVLITVGGDATVKSGGRLAVYAANASGLGRQTLYDEATVFDVAGAFNIDAGATVYPDADPRTGAPVRFRAQTILLAAGGAINADRRGYDFVSVAIMDRATFFSDGGFSLIEGKMIGSFTPGTGVETDAGGGYGANGDRAGALGGVHYGFDAAPFQPGAPSGHYSGIGPVRGGGAVWLDAMQVTLGGTITANGTCGTYGQSSGGGVWIVAKALVTSADAVIHADGGAEGVCNFTALSSGGRVALGLALTAEEEAALVAGTTPETVTVVEGVVGFMATVNGGSKNSGASRGQAGTIRTVTGTYVPDTSVTVVGSPKNALSPVFSYGASIVTAGSTFALPPIGYGSDPDDSLLRYPYGGWVLTDEDGKVVESGKEGVSFTVPQGNTTLTILWKNKESGTLVSVPDATLGAVSVGGVSHDADFTYFITGSVEFTAVPASGAEFLYWVGEVPAGHQLDNPLTIEAGVGRRIQPVFRTAAEATVRAWTGAAGNGLWLDAANWSPEGVPGLNDTVTMAEGLAVVTNFLSVKTLALSGTARLFAGANIAANSAAAVTGSTHTPYVDPVIEEVAFEVGTLTLADSAGLALGGQDEYDPSRKPRLAAESVKLSGASVLVVTAGATNATDNFETGCGAVTVAGVFEIADTAQFVPASDQYTGGSLIVRPRKFVLGAGAMVNAEGRGFDYRQFKDPKIIAPGQGYTHERGAGYGGKGGFAFGDYGQTYGFDYAPIHPGSCSGIFSGGSVVYPAGGLIRIHAKSAVLNGTLNAKPLMGYYGGSSGGGVWVTTTGKMEIGVTFAALARGGSSNTGADGGGGRIALGEQLTDTEVAKLAADGEVPLRGSRRKPIPVLTQKEFESLYSGATIDLTAGGSHGQPGTFAFLNGAKKGLILMVR